MNNYICRPKAERIGHRIVVTMLFALLLPVKGCSTGKSGVRKCDHKRDGLYQHCSSCKKFIKCRDGKLIEKDCAPDKVWDDKAKDCVWSSTTCSWV